MKPSKKNTVKTSNSRSNSRRAEGIIRKWIKLGELDLFFSRGNFDCALEESKFAERVADFFIRQHPVSEWAAILPLSMSDDRELAETTACRAGDFVRRTLPDAYYSATLLVMYQSLCYALNEKASGKVLRDLEQLLAARIRASKRLTRDARGAPEKWDKYMLEHTVRLALTSITNKYRMTLNEVASKINERFKEEIEEPLSGNLLGKLLKDKWHKGKYKELKAERICLLGK